MWSREYHLRAQKVTNCPWVQQLCRMKTLRSSMRRSSSTRPLKEERSQSSVLFPYLEPGRSSVWENVKKDIFSLKLQKTELKVADTASNMNRENSLWPSRNWPSRTPEHTTVVWAPIWCCTWSWGSLSQMVSFNSNPWKMFLFLVSEGLKKSFTVRWQLLKYFLLDC